MALNDDWVADVRRWYFDERERPACTAAQALESDLSQGPDPIGYEAALPALQLPDSGFGAVGAPPRGGSR